MLERIRPGFGNATHPEWYQIGDRVELDGRLGTITSGTNGTYMVSLDSPNGATAALTAELMHTGRVTRPNGATASLTAEEVHTGVAPNDLFTGTSMNYALSWTTGFFTLLPTRKDPNLPPEVR